MSLLAGSANRTNRIYCIIATIVSVTSYAAAQDGQATPKANAAAKRGSVEQFAAALAEARIPVGVVVLKKDSGGRTGELTMGPLDKTTTLAATVDEFETRYPEYRVGKTLDGIVIAPRSTGWCTRPLRTLRKSLTTSGEAFEVLYRIVRAWTGDNTPYIPPGIVGVGGVDQRPDIYRMQVTVDLTEGSLEEALNAVVRQVPGLGWAVREISLPSQKPQGKDPDPGSAAVLPGCNVTLFDGVAWLETSLTLAVTTTPR